MHIVIDARLIETSTGRYMQRLVEGLNDSFSPIDNYKYTALVPSDHVEKWQLRLKNMEIMAADQKWYSFSEQWSLYRQLRHLRPDLVHFTMPQQPLLWTGPSVTTIHDVTLIRFDNLRPGDSRLIYKLRKAIFIGLLNVVMRRSQAIISPTEFVRQDLGKFFGSKYLDKIHTTHLAGEIPNEEPEELPDLKDKDFLFFVGNAFPYKNIWRIIDAYQLIKADYPNLQLALAGKKDGFYQEIERRAIDQGIKGVHFLGFITDGEKRWAMQNSRAFVTASYSEGFCMPVLEAMIEGSPVISSNASCLPEVVGEAGLLFDPDSSEELAQTIKQVLDNPDLRDDLVNHGKKHAANFSWQRMVSQVYDIYQSILSK